MSIISEKLCKEFKENDDIRDAGLTTPEDVIRFDDIEYGANKEWQVLDVYRPVNAAEKKLPVIVSVHGGGWVYGDKERYQHYCMSLAQRGFAVVNFTYRLAPQYKYPSSLEDTNLVFTWVLNNAKEYGFDTKYVFGVGDSAGAHNLGLYSAICTNPEYAKEYSFPIPEGFVPTAIALNCGAYEIQTEGAENMLTAQLMDDFLPKINIGKEMKLITVTNHITKDFPPTFFMTATGDFLIEQAKALCHKLMEKNVPFQFRFYGDAKKDLGHVFHLNLKIKESGICNDEECHFFKGFFDYIN